MNVVITDTNGGNAKVAHNNPNLEQTGQSEFQIGSESQEAINPSAVIEMNNDKINGDNDKNVSKKFDCVVRRRMRKSKSNSTSSVETDGKTKMKGLKRKFSEPDDISCHDFDEFLGFSPSSIVFVETGVQILGKLIAQAEIEETNSIKRKRSLSKESQQNIESKNRIDKVETTVTAVTKGSKILTADESKLKTKNIKDSNTRIINTANNINYAETDLMDLKDSCAEQNIEISNPLYKEPFKYGWKREIIYKSGFDNNLKRLADIYYYSPKGKKVKSLREVAECLTTKDLTVDNFTFYRESIGLDDPNLEIIKGAKRLRSDSVGGGHSISNKKASNKRTSERKKSITPPPIPLKITGRLSPLKTATTTSSFKVKISGKRGLQKKDMKSSKETDAPSPQWNSQNITKRSQANSEKITSPKTKRILNQVKLQEPCSIRCPMNMGVIPSLQCCICLCLYHSECVGGKNISVNEEYVCKNCQTELEPGIQQASSITPPPLIPIGTIGAHGIKLNHPCDNNKMTMQHFMSDDDVLAKEKSQKSNSPSGIPSMVAKMDSSWFVPSDNEFLHGHDGSLPKPAQNIAHMGGKRYIVIPKNNDMAVQPAIPIRPHKKIKKQTIQSTSVTNINIESCISKIQNSSENLNQDIDEKDLNRIQESSQTNKLTTFDETKPDESDPAIQTMEVHMDVESVLLDKNIENEPRRITDATSIETHETCVEQEIPQVLEKGAISDNLDNPTTEILNIDKKNHITGKKTSFVDTDSKQNFMMSVCAGYHALSKIFQYLKVQELLRAARVCRMWRDLAAQPALWKTVRMKNSQVTDWDGLAASLKRHGTEHLDLRKMLVAGESDNIWEKFISVIPSVSTLLKLELCRCPASVVEEIFKCCPQLQVFSAMSIKCDSLNLESVCNLKTLTELRLKAISGMSIQENLSSLEQLTELRHLSLTSVKELGKKKIDVISTLIKLETLEFGECSDVPDKFGTNVLSKLTNLQRLRLEKGQATCCTFDILDGISKLEKLDQLELINFDIKNGFDKYMANCKNIKRLLIIPTYISQSATSNNMVLSGVTELSNNLTHFVWGVTLELLRVTELFVDQCNQMNKQVSGDSIPVLKPVPCLKFIEDYNQENDSSTPEDKQSNVMNPQVDILPLPQLQKLLLTALPKTRVKILKIPFHATWRQSISDTTVQ